MRCKTCNIYFAVQKIFSVYVLKLSISVIEFELANVGCIISFDDKMSNNDTAQKMKFSIKDFFSKCDQGC